MKNGYLLKFGALSVVIAGIIPSNYACAALDKFDPYAYVLANYDSNVFRLAGDQEAIAVIGDENRDDLIMHYGAGLSADLKLSRQHLVADVLVERADYDEFDELNHTMVDSRVGWQWQVGNLWSGTLGYRYQDQLSSFNEQLVPQKDMRTTNTYSLSAGYQLHPDWKLVAGADYKDASYEERKRLDREKTSALFEIQYKNTLNTTVGIRGRFSENKLGDVLVLGAPASGDYNETEISGVIYWQGSGKSALEARLGYTDLSYDELNQRDFQGTTGRLTYFWEISGKTQINVAAWQETSSLSDEVRDYVLSTGFSLAPTWSITRKVRLIGNVSFVNDDFKAENDLSGSLGTPKREDDTWLYSIGIRWTPIQNLQTLLLYQYEDRDSTINNRDFTDEQVRAKLQYTF